MTQFSQPELHASMQARLQKCLADPQTRAKAAADFTHTLKELGLNETQAQQAVAALFSTWSDTTRPLAEIEEDARASLMAWSVKVGGRESNLLEALKAKLSERAQKVFEQIAPHLADVRENIIDVGCGDGQITQLVSDVSKNRGVEVSGVDICDYRAPGVTVPLRLFDGQKVAADKDAFESAILTNVMHHDADNECILNELDRVVRDKLVIIETVPFGATEAEMEKDKDRTFMNDYFYNRCFQDPAFDIPVPGAFETPQKWVDRLKSHGWKTTYQEDLGYDQPTIKDRHYLIVAERNR